jgi:hypothetical protein
MPISADTQSQIDAMNQQARQQQADQFAMQAATSKNSSDQTKTQTVLGAIQNRDQVNSKASGSMIETLKSIAQNLK